MAASSVTGGREDTTAARRVVSRPPLGAILRVVSGTGHPAEFRLTTGICRIGAGRGSDLVINDDTVSRAHLELELVPHGVAVRDLGSKNGTFFAGQRVQSMLLSLGSRLQIGGVELAIDADVVAFSAPDGEPPTEYRELRGSSAAMRHLFGLLTRLEGSLANVLIEGESGTGKELVARALHYGSGVSSGPFVPVNCGALEAGLARSELFGHRKGAFTGASESGTGAFEAAHGGTLFLDEIGELPLDVQPVLLRALESRTISRIGDSRSIPVDVRVVAATNRDLTEDIKTGRFRKDLYYRLNVVKLCVPPLREHAEDIESLAQHFARQINIGPLPAEVVECFRQQRWDGNVRELRNAVEAYAAIGALPEESGEALASPDALGDQEVDVSVPYVEQKERVVEKFTRAYLAALLEKTGGSRTQAARLAGIERTYLSRLLAKLRDEKT